MIWPGTKKAGSLMSTEIDLDDLDDYIMERFGDREEWHALRHMEGGNDYTQEQILDHLYGEISYLPGSPNYIPEAARQYEFDSATMDKPKRNPKYRPSAFRKGAASSATTVNLEVAGMRPVATRWMP